MASQRFKVRLVIAILGLLGLSCSASAQQNLPFLGRVEGVLTSRTPLEAPFVRDLFNLNGNATFLGQCKLVITAKVNLDTKSAGGTYQLLAADGHLLVANFLGKSTPTATPGVILIEEIAIIDPINSTGRFAGSTGSFTCRRLFNPLTTQTIGSFQGTITAPGHGNP